MLKHTPYQILGVDPQADDVSIRQAYLDLVKIFPPERQPERFREIRQAYQAINDQDSRWLTELFGLPEISFDQLLNQAFPQPESRSAMPPADFLQLLSAEAVEPALKRMVKTDE